MSSLMSSLGEKIPSNIYWRVQLVCVKVQDHTFSKPAQEYNQHLMPLTVLGSVWASELSSELHEIMKFQIILRRVSRYGDT